MISSVLLYLYRNKDLLALSSPNPFPSSKTIKSHASAKSGETNRHPIHDVWNMSLWTDDSHSNVPRTSHAIVNQNASVNCQPCVSVYLLKALFSKNANDVHIMKDEKMLTSFFYNFLFFSVFFSVSPPSSSTRPKKINLNRRKTSINEKTSVLLFLASMFVCF